MAAAKQWDIVVVVLVLVGVLTLLPMTQGSTTASRCLHLASVLSSTLPSQTAPGEVSPTTPKPPPLQPLEFTMWDAQDPNFASKIVDERQPRVFHNSPASLEWRSVKEWSIDYLKAKAGHMIVKAWEQETSEFVHFEEGVMLDEWNGINVRGSYTHSSQELTLGEFLDRATAHSRKWQALSSAPPRSDCSETNFDHDCSPDHDTDGSAKFIYMSSPALALGVTRDLQPYRPFLQGSKVDFGLFFTSAGLHTRVHYDLQDNFFVQIRGRKLFKLYPPEATPFMYLHPVYHPSYYNCQVNPSHVNDTKFPHFHRAQGLEVLLHPGDTLYIPPFWYHDITTLDMSISASIHFTPVKLGETFEAVASFARTGIPLSKGGLWGRSEEIKEEQSEFRVKTCRNLALRKVSRLIVSAFYSPCNRSGGSGSAAVAAAPATGTGIPPAGTHDNGRDDGWGTRTAADVEEIVLEALWVTRYKPLFSLSPSFAYEASDSERLARVCPSFNLWTSLSCSELESEDELRGFAETAASAFASVSNAAVAHVYLENYLENLANLAVGLEDLDVFLKHCFSQ